MRSEDCLHFDTSDAEGYGYPRIGIQIAIPTEYYEATRRTPAYPFVNNAFVEKGSLQNNGRNCMQTLQITR